VQRTSRLVFLVGLLGAEAGAVVVLERLGRVPGFAPPHHGIAQWALRAPTEDLFAVTGRLLGLALAWWLLAATALSMARRVVPGCRRLGALDAVTPAVLRHTLDRALVLGIGASLGFASLHPAGAATLDVPVPRTPVPGVPATTTTTTAPATGSRAATTPPKTEPTAGNSFVVVRPGDNLWVIATRAAQAAGRSTRPSEVAPYWRRVIAVNTARLRSRDPNLIFPGERIVLPPNQAPRG
jgi:hypothetical protein